MLEINALGKTCPIPLIETKKAIKALTSPDTIEILVDNTMAVANIKGFASDNGFKVTDGKLEEKKYKVTIVVHELLKNLTKVDETCTCKTNGGDNMVVAIGADHMGCGDEKLGKNLLKAFIFALTQAEKKPKAILFYNGGAHVTCEGSLSLEDLTNLKNEGVKILTCGTCLDFYGLKDKLKVGEVTNMYDIVSTMESADLVIKP